MGEAPNGGSRLYQGRARLFRCFPFRSGPYYCRCPAKGSAMVLSVPIRSALVRFRDHDAFLPLAIPGAGYRGSTATERIKTGGTRCTAVWVRDIADRERGIYG